MPELPEVETVASYLRPRLVGARLCALSLLRPDLRWPMPAAALQQSVGRRVVAVRRRGKALLLGLEPGAEPAAWLIHLGMTGRLFLSENEPLALHEHWRAEVECGGERLLLRYQDARRFGVLDVVGADGRHRLLDNLGLEPLDGAFDGATLQRAAAGTRRAVKALLMDSAVVVGVGNIYASEACYRAGVDPTASAASLDAAGADALAAAVIAVLSDAIADGGTTLRDFVHGDRSPGYFQQRLDVYGREGASCRRCHDDTAGAATVRRAVQHGRATFYCPRCQA